MATNIFEVSDKYFEILSWNMMYFTQKRPFCVFLLILHRICGFFIIYYNMLLGNVLPWLPTIQSHSKEKIAQASKSGTDGVSIDTKH